MPVGVVPACLIEKIDWRERDSDPVDILTANLSGLQAVTSGEMWRCTVGVAPPYEALLFDRGNKLTAA